MIEVVTLDLDDTLWDAGPVLIRAEEVLYAWLARRAPAVTARYSMAELTLQRRALAAAQPGLAHDFTRLRLAALRRLLADFGYDARLAEPAVEAFLAARSEVSLFAEVDGALRELKREFRLIALTNGNTDLRRTGVAHYFEFALSPAETGTSKPDPRMFEAAMMRAGVSARAMVHVGDEPLCDVEGAHRAAVGAVWINRGERVWPDSFRRPLVEISNLGELRAAIHAIERQRTPPRQ